MPDCVHDLDLRGWAMVDEDRGTVEGLGLAEAIEALRDDLLKARAEGGKSEIQLPVESMTVELTVTAWGVGWGWEPGARDRADGDDGVRRAGGPRWEPGEGRPGQRRTQRVTR